MFSNIKAVTFDAAGTLFEVAEPVGTTYARFARIHAIDAAPDALDREFRALWNQFPPPHENRPVGPAGIDGDEIERQWWKAFVGSVFSKACGDDALLPPEKFDAVFGELFEHYASPAAWRLLPDVLEILETVRGRVGIGVISNFDRRFHPIARGLGLEPFFDAVILSSTAGASKPDAAIFAAAAREIGADPSEILHVGDDPVRDWQGAEDAGFQVYRLDFEDNSIARIPSWIASRQ